MSRLLLAAGLVAVVAIGGVFYGVLQIVTDTGPDW